MALLLILHPQPPSPPAFNLQVPNPLRTPHNNNPPQPQQRLHLLPLQTHRLPPLHPWLIKMGQDPHGRTHLWHPLLHIPIKPIPQQLDLYELPVIDLGQEFVLNKIDSRSFDSLYMEKVAFSWLGSKKEGFVLLPNDVTGKLALFRSGDEGWTIIPDMPTSCDNVCVYKGKLCAVDNTGRTVEVGLDSSASLMADSVFGGDKKFLVECGGELLLVDKYLSSDFGECVGDAGEDFNYEEIYEFAFKRAVKFEVYRLEEEERKWVELASLGDRVLFLGDDCAFCASVSDLCVGKGDCVIFRDDNYFNVNKLERRMGVFNLGEDRISPLSDYPDYSKLFWPPPDWVTLH